MMATIQTLLLLLAMLVVVTVAARPLNIAPTIHVIASMGVALTPEADSRSLISSEVTPTTLLQRRILIWPTTSNPHGYAPHRAANLCRNCARLWRRPVRVVV